VQKLGRVEVKLNQNYQEISIRLLRNYYVIVPLIIIALVWLLGFMFLADNVFKSYRTLIEFGIAGMLFFWLLLGGLIFSTLFWIFKGKEKVMVTSQHIQTEKPIHLYKRRRAYPLDEVYHIRLDRELFKVKRNGAWVDDQRVVIKFETPNKTVAFGRGITQQEAELIVLELAKNEYLKEFHFLPMPSYN
jgi:hypothetical protein